MIFRHPNCHHTYPKTESLRYSLAFSHNSYSYPLIQLFFSYRTRTKDRTTYNKKMQSKSADDAGEADWQVPILQPGQYPVTASTSLSVGRTLPRQLDPEFYARILRSSEPEADFQVPIRAKWLHFSQLEPGHIFMINRPGWTVARSRASQKRLRGGEDQPCNGGWNR